MLGLGLLVWDVMGGWARVNNGLVRKSAIVVSVKALNQTKAVYHYMFQKVTPLALHTNGHVGIVDYCIQKQEEIKRLQPGEDFLAISKISAEHTTYPRGDPAPAATEMSREGTSLNLTCSDPTISEFVCCVLSRLFKGYFKTGGGVYVSIPLDHSVECGPSYPSGITVLGAVTR
ncbi:hypothetical protein RRG08_013146 [Elysia crispata]|uniref:Uncharacterized protein n=1 Tax=Elysia crispata TaxID=231223 RepID=A0AAE1A0W3_9GAST|nr:hypothetical protein RRG08_013146 [Elysia crispata]